MCLQKEIVYCGILRNNILDMYKISKVVDINKVSYFRILLQIKKDVKLMIRSWSTYKRVSFFIIENATFYSINLKKYISNIQKSMISFETLVSPENIVEIKNALKRSPHFKNVEVLVNWETP
jgi:hypothetical protein